MAVLLWMYTRCVKSSIKDKYRSSRCDTPCVHVLCKKPTHFPAYTTCSEMRVSPFRSWLEHRSSTLCWRLLLERWNNWKPILPIAISSMLHLESLLRFIGPHLWMVRKKAVRSLILPGTGNRAGLARLRRWPVFSTGLPKKLERGFETQLRAV